MKRIVSMSLAVVMVVCILGFPMTGASASASKDLSEHVKNVSYYRTSGGGFGTEWPDNLVKIRSARELSAYYERYKNSFIIGWDSSFKNVFFSPIVEDIFLNPKFDESFFKDHFLLFILTVEFSGSNRLRFSSLREKNGLIDIEIERILPSGGTDEEANWYVALEVDGALSDRDFSVTTFNNLRSVNIVSHYQNSQGYDDPHENIIKITSAAELADYYRNHIEPFYPANELYSPPIVSEVFLNPKYDETFFRWNFLLFIYAVENSGSNRLQISSILGKNGVIDIEVERLVPEVGTCDMSYWHIVLEMDRTLLFRDVLLTMTTKKIGNPLDEVAEIIVSFETPPSVALRLMYEGKLSLWPGVVFEDGVSFEEMALAGHARFYQQLSEIMNSDEYEIVSAHHSLFNGVYMRVRGSMVEQIAALPEVSMVEPHLIPEPLANFALTISAEQTTLPQGKNFRINVELKNNSGKGQEIVHSFLFWPAIPNWHILEELGGIAIDAPAPRSRFLEANGVLRNITLMGEDGDGSGWLIGNTLEPGTHELRFRAVFDQDGRQAGVWSNPITLTVTPAADNPSLTGTVHSYNPNIPATVKLLQGGVEQYMTVTAATSGSGKAEQSFKFESVAPGAYTLVITKPGHVSYTIRTVTVAGEDIDLSKTRSAGTMTLPSGDINGDGMVNDTDLAILWLAANYNKSTAQAAHKGCDLNGDGMINDADLAILWLAGNYNKGAVMVD